MPPAFAALDELLDHTYADAFRRLDVVVLLDQPAQFLWLLRPFLRTAT